MNALIVGIDIAQLQIECFRQTKPEGISDNNEDTVSKLPCVLNEKLNFGYTEHSRDSFNLRWFDNIDPAPLFMKHVSPEELQAVAVSFNSAPGVGVDEFAEVLSQLPASQSVGASIKPCNESTHSSGVHIDS